MSIFGKIFKDSKPEEKVESKSVENETFENKYVEDKNKKNTSVKNEPVENKIVENKPVKNKAAEDESIKNAPVKILSGANLVLKKLEKNTYNEFPTIREELKFKCAYEIHPVSLGIGIKNCTFQVNKRKFKNLNFMNGNTIERTDNGHDDNIYEIRERPNGTKFLFHCHDIPIFDSGDMEWDHICKVAIYRDKKGINLIHCQHGYKIPSIKIYLNLQNDIPDLKKWFEKLNW